MPEPVYLPRAAIAEVPEAKLRGYVLNAEHPVGRNKAPVSRRTLNLGSAPSAQRSK